MKFVLALTLATACAHSVPQDSATGSDGKIKGAIPIKLDNGEGIASGIVTYPGGDRVDWRRVELPEGKAGTLDLALSYKTPRPGLRVSFDVFDQYNAPIQIQRAVAHRREAKIDHAKGTYFIRIFAPRRGDAGTYKLKATFDEDVVAPPVAIGPIADPPKLPSVPAIVEECISWDAKNPTCGTACPDDAPHGWRGCKDTCQTPDVNNPACKDMPCPTPPDRHVHTCMIAAKINSIWPACNWSSRDPGNPRCDKVPEQNARIIAVQEQGSDTLVTIAIGSNQLVDKTWHIAELAGSSTNPLQGGATVTIIRVDKTQTFAKIHLRREIVETNLNVVLSPP